MSFIPDKVNPFSDAKDWINDTTNRVFESVASGIGQYLGLLGSRLTSDSNVIGANVAKGIVTKNPLTSTILVAASYPVGLVNPKLGDKMYVEGMESLVTLGTDDLLDFLLPPSLVKIINKQLLPIVTGNLYLRRSLNWLKIPGRIGGAFSRKSVNVSPVSPVGINHVSSFIANHPTDAIVAVYKLEEASQFNMCIRCDRRGHVVVQCYASTTKRGRTISMTAMEKEIVTIMAGGSAGSPVANQTFGFGGTGGGSGSNEGGRSEGLTGA